MHVSLNQSSYDKAPLDSLFVSIDALLTPLQSAFRDNGILPVFIKILLKNNYIVKLDDVYFALEQAKENIENNIGELKEDKELLARLKQNALAVIDNLQAMEEGVNFIADEKLSKRFGKVLDKQESLFLLLDSYDEDSKLKKLISDSIQS